MILSLLSLAVLGALLGLAIYGLVLLRRSGSRWLGAALLAQALLLIAAQIALSTIPFGIGEPLIRVPLIDMLRDSLAALLALGGAAALMFVLLRALLRARRVRLALGALLLILPVVVSGALYGLTRVSLPQRERERDPLKREITLLPGFQWSIYAHGTIDNPTAIAFGPDRKLYIADISGALWVAADANNDWQADSITRWADGFDLLVGLVWHQNELFTASSGKIEALRDTDGDGVADQRRLVVGNLPSLIFRPHSNNGIAIGRDGRLYFGVGSTTDAQYENNPLAATILSVNPDGSDLRVYARGLGNSFDLAFNADGELFAGDNGPSRGPDGEEPPDEFNHIVEGQHYGFPYFYGDPPGAGGTRGALVSFPPHSVPTGITFYSGQNYPPQYRDSAFLTLWQRGEVQWIEVGRTSSGEYLSRATLFADGFLYPIDAITGPDGNLYIADFGTSAIYRITYDPNKG